TTYLSGNTVLSAAKKIKEQLIETASEILKIDKKKLQLKDQFVCSSDDSDKVAYSDIVRFAMYQHNQYQIQAVASEFCKLSPPPFAAHFGEIELDTYTGKIRVIRYLAAVDCGTPINPALVEGQCEGAIVNGISYALTEKYFLHEGRMLNNSFNRYKIFTANDIPDIKIILCPSYEKTGPYGAKSVSEININGPIPTIANAFAYATGIRLFTSPFLSENILSLLEANQ
ncbi:MAG TPA: molybdopterin-dependent oxidoreductase, partial [Exilispira sp.]|nr:molybdopterin-dependent oxidoreductase [Exilispira sp.]